MKGDHAVQKPHTFLTLGDFHVLLSALDVYLQYVRLLNQECENYQDLYTKVDIAVATMDAGNPETLDLSHKELRLLLTALMGVTTALATQTPEGRKGSERYHLLMSKNVARVQGLLVDVLLQANVGKKARLLN